MTRTFKAGDTPRIEAQLTKERDGEDEPIDLEAAEAVYFFMEYVETSDLVSDAEAVIEDESQGEVSYVLDQSQAIEPGEYRAEFVIEWEEDSEVDRRKTWPYDSYIELEAVEAVNREGELEVLLVEQEIDSLTVVNDLTASSATIDDLEAVTARLDRLEQDLDADGFNVTGVGELESASHTTEDTETDDLTVNNEASFSQFSAEQKFIKHAEGIGVNLAYEDFDHLQAGLDFADGEGISRCYIPNGTYDIEAIGGLPLGPYPEQEIVGESMYGVMLDGEEGDNGEERVIRPSYPNERITLKNFSARSDGDNDRVIMMDRDECLIERIRVTNNGWVMSIYAHGDRCVVKDCIAEIGAGRIDLAGDDSRVDGCRVADDRIRARGNRVQVVANNAAMIEPRDESSNMTIVGNHADTFDDSDVSSDDYIAAGNSWQI